MFGILVLAIDRIFPPRSLHAGAGLTCDDGDPRGVGKITRSMNYARRSFAFG